MTSIDDTPRHSEDDQEKTKHTSTAPSMRDDAASDVEKFGDASPPPSLSPPSPNHQDRDSLDYDPATQQVKWRHNDPDNPRNWTTAFKAWVTFQLGMLALCGSLASSIIAPAEPVISKEFGVSEEVTVLVVALYVLGFAVGPSVHAPVGEVYGRKISMLPALCGLALFCIGTGVSQSAAAVFVTRFFAGVFGASPVSNVSAALGDLYAPQARGVAVTFYAVAVCGGPTIGPIIGSALTANPSLGWRWTCYIMAIWCAFFLVLTTFCMPEMHGPTLLKRKAQRLRKETGDEHLWHPHETERININNIVTKYLARPTRMLVTEPMVALIALYASFVYGLLYMTLEVFPIVFSTERGYGPVVSTLPFLGLFVGVLSAMLVNLANQPRYHRAVEANHGRAVPEARLPPMILGGVLFVAGLFWFGWTAAPRYSWVLPTIATGLIGAGFNIIFQQCINYLVDTYSIYAASATAANTLLRSLIACGLPLAARPMFLNLGVGPACSILGGIAALALPVPLIFMRYSLSLRKRSKFAPVDED